MKGMSVRLKITAWFFVIMITIIAAAFLVILLAADSVMQKTIQDNLIETVEDNVDEVEFFRQIDRFRGDNDGDLYIEYLEGYLEIDDDFLDVVNGVCTALYTSDGRLLYGENPIAAESADMDFSDHTVFKLKSGGTVYYIFDRRLSARGVEDLWLRGVVSEKQGSEQLAGVVKTAAVALPCLLLLAVAGGWWIAGRALRPVDKIARTASQIGRGSDLERRIELGEGGDELHRLADVFNEMIARLDKAFKAEQQFTSDASHELRTPMTVIMAQCEYTLEQQRSSEEYTEALEVIHRQGRRMSRLIDDMLCFARMEQNKGAYPPEELSLSKLVADICTDMSLIREKGITLDCRCEEDIYISGNRLLLTRLVTNLISNAYRYGKEGGHIGVTLKKGDEITLAVEDDGIGIEPELQERIFDRFFRADNSRSGEGTGLGLAMVKEIAEFHKASVDVSSTPGQGSVFTVKFPL